MNISQSASVSFIVFSAALVVAPASAQQRAGCTLPSDRPFQTKAEFSPLMETQVFIDNLAGALGDDLMGYVAILQSRTGNIIAEINYGYARTPCEQAGAQPFTRNTAVTWGSVTKVVTAAAVIDQVERSSSRPGAVARRTGRNAASRSFDDYMADYLPRRWNVGDGWKAVKIKHLLSYQGGFESNPPPGVVGYANRVATDETERPVGSRKYSNANYSYWHFMGPFFGPFSYWKNVEEGYSSNEIAYDDYIWSYTRPRWKEVLGDRLFDPLGIKWECNKTDFNGSNYAFYYKTPNHKKGYFYNPLDQKNCASGGIVMSPEDMGVFFHALTHTDEIITQQNYQLLMRTSSNDRFAYDGSTAVSDGRFFWKNGGWSKSVSSSRIPGNTAAGGLSTYVIDYPNGTSAIFASNSQMNSRDLRTLLRDAYNAALAARPEGPRRQQD